MDNRQPRSSHVQILRSSAVVGSASLINVAVGLVRTKAMAVLLGPAGVGLMGLYGAITDVTRSVAELGINGSGVRQIADAVASGDDERIARTVSVLRRVAVFLGLLGAVMLAALSDPVARLTFGNDGHAAAVAVLSLVVLFRLVGDGQAALLQGMRKVGDIARAGVLGGLAGTAVTIALVMAFGEKGIATSLVAVAVVSALPSWWYSRRLNIRSVAMPWRALRQESRALLKLGLAFMASGFLMLGAGYAVRLILMREGGGTAAAGLYQAAWTIGGLYVGFILQSMGTDFYPRLVGAMREPGHANRLVNEQTQVSLLLAGPGVLATLSLAPWVLSLLYSAEFGAAVELLRWVCAGMALRIITWPMGFIIVAGGRQTAFFMTELAWTAANIGLSWWGVRHFGLVGAGVAFFGSYVLHGLMVYPIVRRQTGFRWTAANWTSGLLFLVPLAIAFAGFQLLPLGSATALGLVLTLGSGLYSVFALARLVPADRLPRRIQRLFQRGTLRPAP